MERRVVEPTERIPIIRIDRRKAERELKKDMKKNTSLNRRQINEMMETYRKGTYHLSVIRYQDETACIIFSDDFVSISFDGNHCKVVRDDESFDEYLIDEKLDMKKILA